MTPTFDRRLRAIGPIRLLAMFLALTVFTVGVSYATSGQANAAAKKKKPSAFKGTYKGVATSLDGATTYGEVLIKIKSNGLVETLSVKGVPTNCGFNNTPTDYVLAINGKLLANFKLVPKDVTVSKKGKLKFDYTLPPFKQDVSKYEVSFTKKSATGTFSRVPNDPADLNKRDCQADAKFTLTK
jgi:hypothetical protein